MILEKKNIRLCDGEIYSIELFIDEDINEFTCRFFEDRGYNAILISERDSFRHINEAYDPVNHMKYFIKKANERIRERIRLEDKFKKEVLDWDGTYEDEE